MRITKNYEAPAVELIEALNEGFIAASAPIGSAAGEDLAVDDWTNAF